MKTYDVHTHIGLDLGFYLRKWWPYASTVQDLLLQMDACGIDEAVCFPFVLSSAYDAYRFAGKGDIHLLDGRYPYDRENDLLVDEVRRMDLKKRLHVLAMFDTTRAVPDQVAHLHRLVGKIAGLKLQGTVIQTPVRALLAEGQPILEVANEHHLPVLFHTSYAKNDVWSQVHDCLDVADAFPNVRFNLAHSLRFDVSGLKRAAQTPNVWVDCSAHLAHCDLARRDSPSIPPKGDRVDADYNNPTQVLEAVQLILGGNKYMWGSDNPYMSWCDDSLRLVHTYREEVDVLKSLPETVRTSMLTTGPRAWLHGDKAP